MKSLLIALLSFSSLTTFASRIPVCTITFSGGPEGVGIHQTMKQDIRGSLVIYEYHFENLRVDARFNLAKGNKGMIMMVDKKTDRVVAMTSPTLLDGKDESADLYYDQNGTTYQVDCKYQNEIPESDGAPAKTQEPRAE